MKNCRHDLSFGSFTTDEAKQKNAQQYEMNIDYIDRQIEKIEPLAKRESEQELIAKIMNETNQQSDNIRNTFKKALNDAFNDFEKGK